MMTKALHSCECVFCTRPRAYTCLHHQVAHTASGRREISHDAVERHSVRLTSELLLGTARGLAGRCDASWHVAESVILRGRPGTQKK